MTESWIRLLVALLLHAGPAVTQEAAGFESEPGAAVAQRPAAPRYAGRKLAEVLESLRAQGLDLIYSTDLVRDGMKVRDEPRASAPRLVLNEVLAPHGLVAAPGPGDSLVVVKPPPSTGAGRDAPEALRLGFEDSSEVPGAPSPTPVGAGTLRLGARDVLQMPGAVDNIFRALQVMPGITGAGFFDTRISVRGGAPDQNLTVMDGVEIHNPFRLFGAVAAFNPETVARFDLVAGAFPAQYGDRLSSLLIVETRDGRRDDGFGGSATASVTDASAVLEGRLPGVEDASFLFASRRTYYDLVAGRIVGGVLPHFDDLQLKLAWSRPAGQRLAFTAWRSREGANGDWSDAADTAVLASTGANELAALSYAAPLGRALLRGVASAYRFEESLELDLEGRTGTRVSFDRRAVDDSSHQVLTLDLTRAVEIRDLALRQELEISLAARHRLDLGVELHQLDTRWRQLLPADRMPEQANGSSAFFGAGLPDFVDSAVDGTRAAAFVQHRGRFGERLLTTTGLRLERTPRGALVFSPRFLAAWDLGRAGRLKAGAGIHTQSPGYEKLIHSDYFLDLGGASRAALGEERSLHLVLGLARSFGRGVDASVEGYYRDFSNLVVGRLESEPERAARLARYDYPADLAWGLPTEPVITSVPASDAEGRAYGVLASLSFADPASRRLNGWIAYAWGVANRTAYGHTYPFDYDRPHALSTVASYRFSPKLELGLSGRLASGRPTTPPRGVLVLGAADASDRDRDGNREELLPARDASGRLVYVADAGGASTLNSSRLPAFARFDLRLSYSPRGPSGRWLFYLEALNLLNRRNSASYNWEIHLDEGAARPHVEVHESKGSFPILPTVGARFRF